MFRLQILKHPDAIEVSDFVRSTSNAQVCGCVWVCEFQSYTVLANNDVCGKALALSLDHNAQASVFSNEINDIQSEVNFNLPNFAAISKLNQVT